MRVLLLGGTGAIGENLAHILGEKGVKTFVTSRRERLSFKTVSYINGNAHDLSFLKQICTNCFYDAIVDFMSYDTYEFESRIDLLLSSTKQYVFISSARVYSGEELPITEGSSLLLDVCKDIVYLNSDEYALTKARQENILISHSKSNNFTIVRPYITYNQNRLQLGVMEKEEWLYRALQGHTVVFNTDIADKSTTMTSGYDVALGISLLLGMEYAYGEILHITNSQHRTWRQILDIYSKTFEDVTGKELKIKYVSLGSYIKCRPEALRYQVVYDRLYNRIFDVRKEKSFNISQNFIDPENGIKDCLTLFLKNSIFKSIDFKYEGVKDRLTGECYNINKLPNIKQKIKYIKNRFFL